VLAYVPNNCRRKLVKRRTFLAKAEEKAVQGVHKATH